jgi:hypothetical protein
MTDRKVQVNLMYRTMPPANGLPGINQLPLAAIASPAPFANAGGVYPSFPNDAGTRGTQIGEIVTAALKAACGDCAEPADCAPYDTGAYGLLGIYCGPPPALEVQVQQYIPEQQNYYRQSLNIPPTHSYDIESRYEDDRGIRQIAPTGPPPSTSKYGEPPPGETQQNAEMVQVRSRVTRRIVTWTCESYGFPPPVPPDITNDQNEVFLYGELTPTSVYLMPDGHTLAFRISGVYTYGLIEPRGVGDILPFDVPPWIEFAWGDAVVDNYQHGIIDSGDGSSGEAAGVTA